MKVYGNSNGISLSVLQGMDVTTAVSFTTNGDNGIDLIMVLSEMWISTAYGEYQNIYAMY